MLNYLNALRSIKDNGIRTSNRTGTDTISMFGDINLKFSLSSGNIPIVTTKKIHIHSIIHELLWMLSGDSNTQYLNYNNVHIWDEWADENGDLGPVYGSQWRRWDDTRVLKGTMNKSHIKQGFKLTDITTDNGHVIRRDIDQIAIIEDLLANNNESRRIILTAWNVSHIDEMKLPPCHTLAQFMVIPMTEEERLSYAMVEYPSLFYARRDCDNPKSIAQCYSDVSDTKEALLETMNGINNLATHKLSCKLYQRSADFFLGVPFNITFYALLTHMLAKTHRLAAGDFFHSFGDAHIYVDHLLQVEEQLGRDVVHSPKLSIPKRSSILDYTYDDIQIKEYDPHPAIKAKVSV